MVKMKSLTERSVELLDQGHHYVDIDLDETVIFIRPNHVIPMSSGGQSVAEVDFGSLELLGYVEDKAVYELYDDDGYGKDYENSDHYTTITVSQDGTVTAKGIIERRYTLSI